MRVPLKLMASGAAVLALIQLVPYGRDHVNPPVVKEPRWNSAETRAIVKRVCFNCHSNETEWPWYSAVAPVSWLVYRDVVEARGMLNFSDWQSGYKPGESPGLIAAKVLTGKMPPLRYLLAHPEARMTQEEKKLLVEGMKETFSSE